MSASPAASSNSACASARVQLCSNDRSLGAFYRSESLLWENQRKNRRRTCNSSPSVAHSILRFFIVIYALLCRLATCGCALAVQ